MSFKDISFAVDVLEAKARLVRHLPGQGYRLDHDPSYVRVVFHHYVNGHNQYRSVAIHQVHILVLAHCQG